MHNFVNCKWDDGGVSQRVDLRSSLPLALLNARNDGPPGPVSVSYPAPPSGVLQGAETEVRPTVLQLREIANVIDDNLNERQEAGRRRRTDAV